jgi:predicted nucleic acid-binding protein
LELGVLMAKDSESRAMRLATLTRVREQTSGLPADDRVVSAYARLAASELHAGRKPRVHDTWIAATALAHGGEVWTQDKDFTGFQRGENPSPIAGVDPEMIGTLGT